MATTTKTEGKKTKNKKTESKKISAKTTTNGKADKQHDASRHLASFSEGKLNTAQVRILMALRAAKTSPTDKKIDRSDLKELVGIGRDGLYSKQWLDSLKALAEEKLIGIYVNEDESKRGFVHALTAKGAQNLKSLEEKANKAIPQ